MTGTLTRRTALKAGIWAVPVVAVAVATPLAAASEPPVQTKDRLTFNTKNVNDQNPWNGSANVPRIEVRSSAMDTTGPDAVGPVTLTMTLVDSAGVQQTRSTVRNIPGGWQTTGDWVEYFDNVARGAYTVYLTASAQGVTPISLTLPGRTVS
ncbi:hypothetical protein SEA_PAULODIABOLI_321 [Microbacterium phage PauloDiaboli]|nr:hypothetical protein SEA_PAULODIABOLI_321 [Microbacterium phage PauloDiaboli]